jgi:hypothetical protein
MISGHYIKIGYFKSSGANLDYAEKHPGWQSYGEQRTAWDGALTSGRVRHIMLTKGGK